MAAGLFNSAKLFEFIRKVQTVTIDTGFLSFISYGLSIFLLGLLLGYGLRKPKGHQHRWIYGDACNRKAGSFLPKPRRFCPQCRQREKFWEGDPPSPSYWEIVQPGWCLPETINAEDQAWVEGRE